MLFRLYPLLQAEIMAPVGIAMPMGDMSTFFTAPVYIWYLEGSNKKIVIDAGVESPGPDGLVHGFPILGGGEEGARKALAEVDIKPEDVDILILTHLHFDHSATTSLFKNAKIYVQKKEWETAFNPVPIARPVYDTKLLEIIENMDIAFIDGDYNLIDGVKLILLPGHTEGLQGIQFESDSGTAVLAGDHFYTYFNINPSITEMEDLYGKKVSVSSLPNIPFIPPAININVKAWYESCWKIMRIVSRKDLIIPGHEPSIKGKIIP